MADIKSRAWCAILYPESLPSNWLEVLRKTHLPLVVSPLHDKDIDLDGTLKKPHYHIMLIWSGPTTLKCVKRLIVDQLHQPYPEPVYSIIGEYEYFIHKNDPDKYQYDSNDLKIYNGFNPADYWTLSNDELKSVLHTLNDICLDNNFREYCDLLEYVRGIPEEGKKFEYVLTSHCYHFQTLCTSLRHKGAGLRPPLYVTCDK